MENKRARKKIKVIFQHGLNIRELAKKDSTIIGVLKCGDVVEISAKKNGYGHIKDGWINLDFTIEL